VVERNSRSTVVKRAGSVRCGKWPDPSNTSSRLFGRWAWARWAWATGMIGSRSPHTSRVGIDAAR
jgi:hypothetical protein